MGLKRELFQAEGELFKAFCANVNDAVLVLESAMHEEGCASCHKHAVVVVQVGMNDDVGDSRLVFQAEKDEAQGRAGALASDDRTR